MSANLKPYPAMKDSGVPWLGEVPTYWEVRRLKSWLDVNEFVLSEDTDPEYTFEYLDIGSVATGRLTAKPERIRFGNSPSRARRVVRPGDTIVSTVRTYLKAVWHAEHPGDDLVASTGFAVLTPPRGAFPRFVSYFCQSDPFINRVTAEAVGIAYPAIAETRLGTFEVCIPPYPEQAAIVRFLDHADRRIRRYVRAKQKLIALLEEQKQAIIHQAVTGQIDVRTCRPYPAYKPSGVEELGDVPEHWEVVALKRMLTRLIDCEHKTAPAVSASDNYVVRTTAVRAGTIRWEGTYCTDGSSYMEWTKRGVPQVGDVIFTREAPAGEACLVPEGRRVCLGQRTVLLKPRPTRYDAAFLVHMIYAGPPRLRVQLASQGSTVSHFNVDDIGRMPVLAPPLEEQATIVEVLRRHTGGIDRARQVLEREVRLLQEYHARLIADVVTGKFDVREAAARLPDEVEELEPLDEADALIDGEEEPTDDLATAP